jgi:thioredoxin 1
MIFNKKTFTVLGSALLLLLFSSCKTENTKTSSAGNADSKTVMADANAAFKNASKNTEVKKEAPQVKNIAAVQDEGVKAPEKKDAPAETPKAAPAKKGRLLFFMNPNGRPCQRQDQILQEVEPNFEGVEIQYVKTTVNSDNELFYYYGVRALPQIILEDTQGKEVKRFPPGIKDHQTILDAVEKL